MQKQILSNFHQVTSVQGLADQIGWQGADSTLRSICYQLGLYRLTLEYWTPEQIRYLKANFKKIGDCELAEVFNVRWPKGKGWTKKHIEKKRKYLALKRTSAQIKAIHHRNVVNGRFALCPVKRWLKSGVTKEGEIHYWRNQAGKSYAVVKTKAGFVPWNRWAWQNAYGNVPHGMNVVFKDGNSHQLLLSNLEIISNAELSRRNSKTSSQGLSDNYVAGMLTHGRPLARCLVKELPALLEVKRKQLIVARLIKQNQAI